MAIQYSYNCAACDYEHVGLERVAFTMMSVTIKVECLDCRRLYDVRPMEGLPLEGIDWRPRPDLAVCPRRQSHRARLWPEPMPCPKCGEPMKRAMTGLMID